MLINAAFIQNTFSNISSEVSKLLTLKFGTNGAKVVLILNITTKLKQPNNKPSMMTSSLSQKGT